MTQLSNLQQVWQFILYLLFPPQCVICQTTSQYFCTDCQNKLAYIQPPICDKCGNPRPDGEHRACLQCRMHPLEHIDAIRSVATYHDSPLKTAIHKFKYGNQQVLGQTFASLLANCYAKEPIGADVIVPVPLHKSRFKERGYNQSALLAAGLSKLINKPVDDKTLVRHKKTAVQMTLQATMRKSNVIEAFSCVSNTLADKIVLLIDDVCTTGATLDSCAKALKLAKVRTVYGLTLARTL